MSPSHLEWKFPLQLHLVGNPNSSRIISKVGAAGPRPTGFPSKPCLMSMSRHVVSRVEIPELCSYAAFTFWYENEHGTHTQVSNKEDQLVTSTFLYIVVSNHITDLQYQDHEALRSIGFLCHKHLETRQVQPSSAELYGVCNHYGSRPRTQLFFKGWRESHLKGWSHTPCGLQTVVQQVRVNYLQNTNEYRTITSLNQNISICHPSTCEVGPICIAEKDRLHFPVTCPYLQDLLALQRRSQICPIESLSWS